MPQASEVSSEGNSGRTIKQPTLRRARRAFMILFAINVLNYADRYILPAVLPKVKPALGLTTTEEGILGSSFLFVYAIATLPLSVWADRAIRSRVVAVCVSLWSIATALAGAARSFWQLFAVRAFLGVGEAGYGPASISLLGDLFPRFQRGRILSYWSAGNLIGAAIGFAAGGFVADALGWRWAFYLVGGPGLVVAYLAARLVDPPRGVFDVDNDAASAEAAGTRPSDVEAVSGNIWQTVLGFMRIRTYVAVVIALVLSFFAIGSTSFWLPTYLVKTFDLSVGKAGAISGALLIVSGLSGTLLGGWFADYLQARRANGRLLTCSMGLLIGAPLIFVTLAVRNLTLFMIIFGLAGISLSLCTGPIFAVVQDVIVPAARATALGVVGLCAHLFGDAAAPTVVGVLASRSSLHIALITTTPTVVLLSGLACLMGAWSVRSDMQRVQEELHGSGVS